MYPATKIRPGVIQPTVGRSSEPTEVFPVGARRETFPVITEGNRPRIAPSGHRFMNPVLGYLTLFLLSSVGSLLADRPRWGFLGDDEQLEAHFGEVKQVAFVCVTEVELRDVKPPFAEVIYHATVIECFKGELEVEDRIQITFATDSLPIDDEERQEFIENANKRNIGGLKFAFLDGGADGTYSCEFMDLPTYTADMLHFLRTLKLIPARPQAEQDGADQPANP